MDTLKRIDELRLSRGWTIYRLADEAGLTQSTLSNMFARGTQPSLATLSALCTAFGITLSQFFDEDTVLNPLETGLINDFRKLSDCKQNAIINLVKNLNEE